MPLHQDWQAYMSSNSGPWGFLYNTEPRIGSNFEVDTTTRVKWPPYIFGKRIGLNMLNICKSQVWPSVRWSQRPLSACHSRRKCSMENTLNSAAKVEFSNMITTLCKVWSMEGSHCIWLGYRMSLNILERETSLIRSPY